jgi:putative ABC transport system permease protein
LWRFLHQLGLALEGIRRKPALSATVVVILSLAGAMWTFGVVRYLRHHGPYPPLTPTLHQVDVAHGENPQVARAQGSTHTTASWATHTRVSFPEYSLLSASGIPPRQTGSFRARLLVSTRDGTREALLARLAHARFVNAAFFSLFQLPLGRGRPFTSAEEMGREPVMVLGQRLARTLFAGADPIGRSLLVEGRPFRIVGVVAGDQPFRPTWDIPMMDGDQDALYLPFGWFRPLRARPEAVVVQAPVGPTFEDLLQSEALFVSFWLDLPTPEQRAAYRRYLDRRLGQAGYLLRDYREWTRAFRPPLTRVAFLSALCALLLLTAGLSSTRLLLIKAQSRDTELAVRRALGATRRAIFLGQLLEAALLSLLAAGLGLLLSLPYLGFFNRVVADTDIPARLTGLAAVVGAGGVCLVGLASAAYPAWRRAGAALHPRAGQ